MSKLEYAASTLTPDKRGFLMNAGYQSFTAAMVDLARYGDVQDAFHGIHPEDLMKLILQLDTVESVWEAYSIIGRPLNIQGTCWYDRIVGPQHATQHQAILEFLKKGAPVGGIGVDLGAGSGLLTTGFEQYTTVHAVDLSAEMLESARLKMQNLCPKVLLKTHEVDITRARHFLQTNSVNTIVTHGTLPYLTYKEVKTLLTELWAVLKKGGKFVRILSATPAGNDQVYLTSNRGHLAGIACALVFNHIDYALLQSGPQKAFDHRPYYRLEEIAVTPTERLVVYTKI